MSSAIIHISAAHSTDLLYCSIRVLIPKRGIVTSIISPFIRGVLI